MSENSFIGERFGAIMKHYGLNKNSFAVKLGLGSNSGMSRIVNDPNRTPSFDLLAKVLEVFDEIDPLWLILNKGDMLKSDNLTKPLIPEGSILYYKVDQTTVSNLITNDVQPTSFLKIYGYMDCDIATDVFGESMSPKFIQGDVILCKEVSKKNIVELGEAYLIMTVHGDVFVRYIKSKADSLIKVGAENPRYEDQTIKIDDIARMYIIKGTIRRLVL